MGDPSLRIALNINRINLIKKEDTGAKGEILRPQIDNLIQKKFPSKKRKKEGTKDTKRITFIGTPVDDPSERIESGRIAQTIQTDSPKL